VSKGLAAMRPELATLGKFIGGVFCVTLLISAITGGNMFQAWNVGNITQEYFGVPSIVSGMILAVVVGMVIIGGVKRIGEVAGKLVPFMCVLYMIAGLYVLGINFEFIPETLRMIVYAAFNPVEATGAFIGGTAGYAFLWGMKRALFSNEAGQGSAPIAMSAAKTHEPARIGILAGLEPFIDTLVVCTVTALVILTSGIWQRAPEAVYQFDATPAIVEVAPNVWTIEDAPAPPRMDAAWRNGDLVFAILDSHHNPVSGNTKHRLDGTVRAVGGDYVISWATHASDTEPSFRTQGIFVVYNGATLTAKAFDEAHPGLGMWLVTIAAWLFAISTMISWSYYGEQGMVYLAGKKSLIPYKLVFCALIIVATAGVVQTDAEHDNLTGLGTGVMLFANVPIMLFFGYQAMRAYHSYVGRLKRGEFAGEQHEARALDELMRGRDD
jgi:alanine or glycine:cation symporter, AGCS family